MSSPRAYPFRTTVSDTDDLIALLRQHVQGLYQIPPHEVLVLWNDEPLETKLKRIGPNSVVEVSEQSLQNLLTRKSLSLPVLQNEKLKTRLTVKVEVDGWSEAFVTSRALTREEKLNQQNVQKVRLKLSQLPQRYLKPGSVILEDFKVLSNLPASTLVTQTQVREYPLVTKGNQVKVYIVNENVVIEVEGQALEAGTRGQTVKVKILTMGTNKIVEAQVAGPGEVKVTVNPN